MQFIKMHGAGNDYVFCDGFEERLPADLSELASRISDRHVGIGADGLVAMIPATDSLGAETPSESAPSADVVMQMWNADGSSGTMCGNAARCVAFWMKRSQRVFDRCRILMGDILIVADVSGVAADSVRSESVSLQLPGPRWGGQISLDGLPSVQQFCDLLGESASLPDSLVCERVDCGNQHAVIFVSSLADELVHTLGPLVEAHSIFPDRINVEFVSLRNRRMLDVRVWERGSGETLSCGSGACASAVAAIRRGLCDADAEIGVQLPGGLLRVQLLANSLDQAAGADIADGLILKGPVCFEFEGVWMGDNL